MAWVIEVRDCRQSPMDEWQFVERLWKGGEREVEAALRKYTFRDAHVEWVDTDEAHSGDGTLHYRATWASWMDFL